MCAQRKAYANPMKTAKKTIYSYTLSLLSLVVLLSFLLTACGTSTSTGMSATPVPTSSETPPAPTNSAATPPPGQVDQNLIYTYRDSAIIWHVSRYNSRTGQEGDVYTTAAGQITEAQVSCRWSMGPLSAQPVSRSAGRRERQSANHSHEWTRPTDPLFGAQRQERGRAGVVP